METLTVPPYGDPYGDHMGALDPEYEPLRLRIVSGKSVLLRSERSWGRFQRVQLPPTCLG